VVLWDYGSADAESDGSAVPAVVRATGAVAAGDHAGTAPDAHNPSRKPTTTQTNAILTIVERSDHTFIVDLPSGVAVHSPESVNRRPEQICRPSTAC
jgi:hypothetical protein